MKAVAAYDPRKFRVSGPAVINVSGGRTSAFLLYAVLEAHDGKLPADVLPVFANTGREMPQTLDFLDAMSRAWGVHIHWIEYRRDAASGRVWSASVNHNSASRNGEPFEQLLEGRGWMLPGPQKRFCTQDLKIAAMHRYVHDHLGWRGRHKSYIGLRADELQRVDRLAYRNAHNKDHHCVCLLAKARITKDDHITPFWAQQPFDLDLPGFAGNCDGCFLKTRGRLLRMINDYPERMQWWVDMEHRALARGYTGGQFRSPDRESHRGLFEWVRRNPALPGIYDFDPDDIGFDVMETCDVGCGA